MYDVQASVAVPSMLIPNPAGFFVLNIRRPRVQALHTLHSFRDGLSESQEVSVRGDVVVVGVDGCLMEPSR